MSRRLGELCALFVEDHFGGLAKQIFTCLADSGRLHIQALHARLPVVPPFDLKRGLITLIQQHLVLHFAAYDDDPTYFSVDWEAAYLLIRTRKFLNMIEELEGENAREISDYVMRCGHISVEDLVAGLPSPTEKVPTEKLQAEELEVTSTAKVSTTETLAAQNKVNGEKEHNSGREHEDDDKDDNDAEPEEEEEDTKEESVTATRKPRSEKDINLIHQALRSLLKRGILVKVTERTYIPHADLDQKVRDTVQVEKFPDGKIKGSKKSREFQTEVNALKRKYQATDDYSDKRDIGSHGELKHSDTNLHPNKRLKTNEATNGVSSHGEVNGISHDENGEPVDKIRNDLVVRVSFSKCLTLMRNRRIVTAVEERLGPVSAAVYTALLRALEDVDQPIHEGLRVRGERQGVKDDDDSDDEDGNNEDEVDDYLPKVKNADLLQYLTMSNDELAAGMKEVIPLDDLINGTGNYEHDPDLAELGIKQNIKQEPKSDDEASDEEDHDPIKARAQKLKERNRRLRLIDIHLGILAEHPWQFCIHDPGSSETKIDFAPIGAGFVTAELDTIFHARFGKIGHRIIRLFRDHGKADDFHIARALLTKAELIELKLTELHNNGLIRIQEVPKDTSRQPNRTLYLYFYDEEMARGRILDLTYQAMGRFLQRLKHEERTRFQGALEKLEYLDGTLDKLDEEQGLSKMDVKTLKKWVEVQDAMEVQVQRLDDIVLILRDIGGTDRSLLM